MAQDLVCVIDAGTTGLRTMIFDFDGNEIDRAYQEYKSYFPKPAWVEQDANDWWQAVCNTSNQVLKRIKASDIVGISVTNQRETIVPVDETGSPLRKALVWQDRRTIPECNFIKDEVGEDEIYRITGLTIDPYFSSSKIIHIKNQQPDIFSKTYKFLLVHDYIEMKLSEKFITDWSNASRTMLFDIEKHEWSKNICNKLEIPIEKMPQTYPSGEIIGEITKNAAKQTGFIEGTPIISGGGDQQLGALGLGVIKSGQVSCTTGTGTFILAFLDKPLRDPQKRVLCSCHSIPKTWVMEASIFTTGSVYRWFRDQFSQYEKGLAKKEGKDPYDLLNEEAAKSPLGSNGIIIIPHFAGAGAPHWYPYSRGIIAGLALGHSRNDLIRAIMESICYEIRKNIDVMRQLKIQASEIRITGGMTRSSVFNEIQTDIYGIPVLHSKTEEATALGAAMLVLKGTKIYKSYDEIAKEVVKISETKKPNNTNHKKYSKIFDLSKKIYDIFQKNNLYNDFYEMGE
ncbi:MAG: xylulokinase [Candidatus Helarchaeota archaeon]|nr:xylulokinase [Candidatus Helarchaeota archaeon]